MISPENLEVSVSSGYNYKKNLVSLKIGKDKFSMMTKGSVAWSDNQDKDIIKHMLKAHSVIIEGTSSKGTYSQDLYLLKGFSTSLKWMLKHCNEF